MGLALRSGGRRKLGQRQYLEMAAASIVGHYLAMSAVLRQSEGYFTFTLDESTIPHVTFTLKLVDFVVFGTRLAPCAIVPQKSIARSQCEPVG
jgi:hypothetical protein